MASSSKDAQPKSKMTAPSSNYHVACWHPYTPLDVNRLTNKPGAYVFHPRWCLECTTQRKRRINELYVWAFTQIKPQLNRDDAWRVMFIRGVWAGRIRMQSYDTAAAIPEEPDNERPESWIFEQSDCEHILSRLSRLASFPCFASNLLENMLGRLLIVIQGLSERRLARLKCELETAFTISWIGGMKSQKELEVAALDLVDAQEREAALEKTLAFELQLRNFI